MNGFLWKLEKKFGRFAIKNLSLYIVIAYVLGYVLMFTGSVDFITLNPFYIAKGQVWRILTWLLVPPARFDIFTIIMLYFYYSIGSTLERTWGAFRYNVYIFSGILFTVIGAFLLYYISVANGASPEMAGYVVSGGFSTYYINMSIFLAFAAVYPNIQVLLFFIIPVKMKWLGFLDVILLGYSFLSGGIAAKIAIVMSLLNFIVFFFTSRDYRRFSPKEFFRRQSYKKATQGSNGFGGFTTAKTGTASYGANRGSQSTSGERTKINKHKCSICGRTELDDDNLEFRFCSKCNGNYEYCSDHLFTHKHVE